MTIFASLLLAACAFAAPEEAVRPVEALHSPVAAPQLGGLPGLPGGPLTVEPGASPISLPGGVSASRPAAVPTAAAPSAVSAKAVPPLMGTISGGDAALSDGPAAAPAASQTRSKKTIKSAQAMADQLGGLSQAQQLAIDLEKVDPVQRQELYAGLGAEENLGRVVRAVRDNDRESMPEAAKTFLARNPGMQPFLLNLVQFGDQFPGIFKLGNADQTVSSVLTAVQQKEKISQLSNPDLLKTEGLTYRLSRVIDETIIDVITQAGDEYGPARFGRTAWNKFWHGVKIWWLPLYKRVSALTSAGQFFQKQLERYRIIDGLVLRQALSNAVELKLTNEEVGGLVSMILKSPAHVDDIEKALRKIYHKDLAADHLIPIGDFDLYRMHKSVKKFDFEGSIRGFDDLDLEELTELDRVLEASAERLGRPRRTLHDDDLIELQLYFEAYERGVTRYSNDYHGYTNQTSNESYTVERQHTETYACGTDDKGNTKYCTRTYYTTETVEPSFENILADSYDTGDRSVWGLDSIRSRAAKVVASERPQRSEIAAREKEFEEAMKAYAELATAGATKKHWFHPSKSADEVKAGFLKAMESLDQTIAAYAPYVDSSNGAILAQYGRDSVDNFRGRNQAMMKRLKNMRSLLAVLDEFLNRKELQLRPTFHLWDYTDWMYKLRHLRNRNYAVKTFLVAAAAGLVAAYNLVPDFQSAVDGLWSQILSWFGAAQPSIDPSAAPPADPSLLP